MKAIGLRENAKGTSLSIQKNTHILQKKNEYEYEEEEG